MFAYKHYLRFEEYKRFNRFIHVLGFMKLKTVLLNSAGRVKYFIINVILTEVLIQIINNSKTVE